MRHRRRTSLRAASSCAAREYRVGSWVFGTMVLLRIAERDAAHARGAAALVLREFDRMHRDLHAWNPGELVALNQSIARGEDNILTTFEIAALIREAQRLAERCGGLLNPAVGKLVGLWGFHRDRPGGPVPAARQIRDLLRANPCMSDLSVSANSVSSSNPIVQLDFGGCAKGHALDRAAEILRANGVRNALVNVGGNIMALGRRAGRAWRVGIEAPRGGGLLGTVALEDGEAIGTSGDYRRFCEIDGRRFSHIIDPRIGYPVAGVASVTVLARSQPRAGLLSDAASKPIFSAGIRHWESVAARMGISSAMLVDAAGDIHVTAELMPRLRFLGSAD